MPGPRPTPTAQLEARGSWRAKERIKKGKEVLSFAMPKPPKWVSAQARKLWPEIREIFEALRVTTNADAVALGMLADRLVIYINCRKIIEKEGYTAETMTAGQKAHPMMLELTKAWNDVFKALKEFGATPAARRDVERIAEEKVDESPQAKFFGGGA